GLSIPQLRQDNLNYAAQLETQTSIILNTFLANLALI
ncbi:MAG: glutamine amidotransferase, partial [Acinetobacter sp.]